MKHNWIAKEIYGSQGKVQFFQQCSICFMKSKKKLRTKCVPSIYSKENNKKKVQIQLHSCFEKRQKKPSYLENLGKKLNEIT